jgi:hypothetical protein
MKLQPNLDLGLFDPPPPGIFLSSADYLQFLYFNILFASLSTVTIFFRAYQMVSLLRILSVLSLPPYHPSSSPHDHPLGSSQSDILD